MKAHKTARKEAAALRQEASNKLTASQRIAKLDAKFGTGVGAKKERAKLQAKLDGNKSSR